MAIPSCLKKKEKIIQFSEIMKERTLEYSREKNDRTMAQSLEIKDWE